MWEMIVDDFRQETGHHARIVAGEKGLRDFAVGRIITNAFGQNPR